MPTRGQPGLLTTFRHFLQVTRLVKVVALYFGEFFEESLKLLK